MVDELVVTQNLKKSRNRFWEIDFARGICVLLMIFDHIMQLMFLSNDKKLWQLSEQYLNSTLQNTAHPVVRAMFFLLCGISCVLSKSNEKRGIRLLAVAAGISLVTLLLETVPVFYGVGIYFGVLHMLAIAVLLATVLMTLSDNIPFIGKFIPAAFGIFCLFFYHLYIEGKSGDADLGYLPALIGFHVPEFASADYAPLFPEMGYVLIGTTLGLFYKSKYKNILKPLDGNWNKPICFIGRNALIVYILLPIVVGGLYIFI